MSVKFSGRLTITKDQDRVAEDDRTLWLGVDYLCFLDSDNNVIIFGPGAQTDLGSIPQWAWSLGFPPDGIGDPAYVIHDILYATMGTCSWRGKLWRTRREPYTRAECDEILRKGLIACGVSPFRARVIWAAVRIGGSGYWGT